jgi:hypothetical protein
LALIPPKITQDPLTHHQGENFGPNRMPWRICLGCFDSISSPRTGVEAILTELGPETQNWRYAASSYAVRTPNLLHPATASVFVRPFSPLTTVCGRNHTYPPCTLPPQTSHVVASVSRICSSTATVVPVPAMNPSQLQFHPQQTVIPARDPTRRCPVAVARQHHASP